ncbi:SusC/RagA family TonB-linked outer membrane protein [Chryseobacterium arthrosphaerae]|uniref:SusC/RagA family TonB-linked outer membrane protein n=1 Tax=Chryseobacterium arthrosphaerae TaxID=651561 RepID=UPI000F504F5D|nr:SusC/RagA family TonB-linked outer membrane protein [Chryseobacterium arthrosphaerae]AYZ14631.1 SusC/RagA family TonB-linked outer membrane protein [Chryseobacterium arthrosphaerae]
MRKAVIPVLFVFSLSATAQEKKSADTTKTTNIQEVVVTSLGIKRQARSLTYSSQQIGGDELTEVKTPNLLNSINGKVSNVQINKTNGGVGGSVRIVMRGDKSTRNSQPLFVIDGIPIINNTGGPDAMVFSQMPDTGDIFSMINPEDIQSINFLKGASASALYGAQGGNGVVLITTKKGSKGKSKLSFSSSLTFDKAYDLPELQYSYLQTTPHNPDTHTPGSEGSWGAKGASKDYLSDFLRTGTTLTNSLTFSAGNEKSQNFFSLGNTTNDGIIPTANFKQYNINFRNSSKFLDDKLTLEANVMASQQDSKNRISPGRWFSPLTSIYWLPRGVDFDYYSNNYSFLDKSRNLPAQSWWNIDSNGVFSTEDQNPMWVLNRNPVTTTNKNFYGSASLNYAINSWLNIQARGNYSYYFSDTERQISAYSLSTVLPGTYEGRKNGRLIKNTIERTTKYGDVILLGSPHITDDISFDFTVGASISDLRSLTSKIDNSLLKLPNLFTANNLYWPKERDESVASYTIYNGNRQDQSVFASTTIGYKKLVYLDLTYRNDWSSTLADLYGKTSTSFDYQSVGANAILSDIFSLPKAISFWKIRTSYAKVGNALDPVLINHISGFDAGVPVGFSGSPITGEQFKDLWLKPELNKTFEAGTEMRFLNNRLSFDFTFYRSNTTNQMLKDVSAIGFGDPYNNGKVTINAGNIQNTGFESAISYDIFKGKKFGWTTTFNASSNKNRIIELLPVKYFQDSNISLELVGSGYNRLKVGGSFGDIYGFAFLRDGQGRIIVDKNGVPRRTENKDNYLGNPNPKFMLGLNNSFNIGNLNVSFLIDGKFGGKVLSVTQAMNDQLGVSKASADARDAGGVVIENAVNEDGTPYTGKTDAQAYYSAIGGRDPLTEAYMYKATAIRLRQASVSYTFKVNSKYLSDATLSVIGTNLFFLYKKAPFDPEQVSGVNPGGVGVDIFGIPITRSLGVSVKLNF